MSKDDLVLPRKINASKPETFARTAEEHSGDTFNMLLKVKERLNALMAEQAALARDLALIPGLIPGLSTVGPSGVDAGDLQVMGTSPRAAREDHQHDVNTGSPIQGIGGGNSEGSGQPLARARHDHTLRETSGPTDMTIGQVFAGDAVSRFGSTLIGKTILSNQSTGAQQNNSTTTLADIVGVSLTIPKAGYYIIFIIGHQATAATTTAIDFAYAYSGTLTSIILRGEIQVNATTFESFLLDTPGVKAHARNGGGFIVTGQSGLFVMWGHANVTAGGVLKLQFASTVGGSVAAIASDTSIFMIQF